MQRIFDLFLEEILNVFEVTTWWLAVVLTHHWIICIYVGPKTNRSMMLNDEVTDLKFMWLSYWIWVFIEMILSFQY